ncbi:MAG: DmsC/YnfH family molybdoenzyme membrane anchor subunit [Paracoccaceae bacterium]
MQPAPSVIIFTVLSGMGFGCLAFLGLGLPLAVGWGAFFHWGLGYALAIGGLMASTFHLGNPRRAWRAFTQVRTSWLSREAWASVAALLLLSPVALSDWLGLEWSRVPGILGAVLCVATVGATSMIYGQLKTIPRWNHWTTPPLFFAFMATGGAILTGNRVLAAGGAVALAIALIAAFRFGDRRFAQVAQTIGTATGLDRIGEVTVFELPHTGQNYLLREMIFVVARKHVLKLRVIAVVFSALLPLALLLILPAHPLSFAIIAAVHMVGAASARWLFFAEAEHVVGLYYGKR